MLQQQCIRVLREHPMTVVLFVIHMLNKGKNLLNTVKEFIF